MKPAMSGFRKFPVIDGEDMKMTQKIDRRTMLAVVIAVCAGLPVLAQAPRRLRL